MELRWQNWCRDSRQEAILGERHESLKYKGSSEDKGKIPKTSKSGYLT